MCACMYIQTCIYDHLKFFKFIYSVARRRKSEIFASENEMKESFHDKEKEMRCLYIHIYSYIYIDMYTYIYIYVYI
jgi:hypothetical protein